MDRLPDYVAARPRAGATAAVPPAAEPPVRRRTLTGAMVAMLPWAIIAGLLWAGLFVKPQPVGSTVQPPLLEQRDHFYGLALAADKVWVAGSNGKILALGADGGIERFTTPTERTLQDIAVWDASHAVAVGNDGVIVFTADGGRTWTAAAEVPRSQVANKLNRVRVADGGVAVATGEMGALLMSRDHGRTWARLRDEEDVAWNDVALLGAGRIRVVGEFGRILTSEDDGASWNEIAAPVPSSLMAVAFRDADVGVAVGLEGVVLVTRDSGRTWHEADVGARDHLFDIAWDAAGGRWIGAGALGRWVTADAEAARWTSGRLDDRDLSWHTRVVPAGGLAWFAGANVGRWDGERWTPVGR
ncbi:WD40/YVTN/BNR-like repeat-containing protein [Aromatoleum toluclasticum]|uniref:WD40/YVTN/BNR-like repeat-containing protein n=1 Tax=Aromatoleum toluclasticum TaxID=92003 RepID=UPI0012FA1E63|nr:YCF48-related protein [Aromatoleum toluclasticum]